MNDVSENIKRTKVQLLVASGILFVAVFQHTQSVEVFGIILQGNVMIFCLCVIVLFLTISFFVLHIEEGAKLSITTGVDFYERLSNVMHQLEQIKPFINDVDEKCNGIETGIVNVYEYCRSVERNVASTLSQVRSNVSEMGGAINTIDNIIAHHEFEGGAGKKLEKFLDVSDELSEMNDSLGKIVNNFRPVNVLFVQDNVLKILDELMRLKHLIGPSERANRFRLAVLEKYIPYYFACCSLGAGIGVLV